MLVLRLTWLGAGSIPEVVLHDTLSLGCTRLIGELLLTRLILRSASQTLNLEPLLICGRHSLSGVSAVCVQSQKFCF